MSNADIAPIELKEGKFIVFEGADACGKGTAATQFCERLQQLGVRFVHTREPGGTHLAEEFRRIALADHQEPVPSITRLMLMMASRAQLCENVIKPALACNWIVVCERYVPSTIVYQGMLQKRTAYVTEFIEASMKMYDFCVPDICFLMDSPAEVANSRLAARAHLDLFERKGMADVVTAYRELSDLDYPLKAKHNLKIDSNVNLPYMQIQMHDLANVTVDSLRLA